MTTALRPEYQHNFAGFHNLPHLDALLQFFCEQQYFIRTSTVHKQPEKEEDMQSAQYENKQTISVCASL